MKHKFTITIKTTASRKETKAYIYCAVKDYGGCYPPEDPFFNIPAANIKIKPKK